jgi:Flp pilus assembly protein TadD
MGILQLQLGRNDEALQSLGAALRETPSRAEAWSDYGIAHARMMRLDDAIKCYDNAIALMPDFAAAYCNKGDGL